MIPICLSLFLCGSQIGFAEVTMERITYHGWQRVYRMTNGTVDLLVLADVGPRILHYGFAGKRNEFHEFAEEAGKTGGDKFLSYGGHRLLGFSGDGKDLLSGQLRGGSPHLW